MIFGLCNKLNYRILWTTVHWVYCKFRRIIIRNLFMCKIRNLFMCKIRNLFMCNFLVNFDSLIEKKFFREKGEVGTVIRNVVI
jgi:hypothetical protein